MKSRRMMALALGLVFALLACWQVWAAPIEPLGYRHGEFAAAGGGGGLRGGGGMGFGMRAGAYGYGMAGHEPELAGLMRDIMALHQINRADLTREQIGQVLPILRNLAREQDRHIARMRRALLDEKARLLKQRGPDTTRPVGIPEVRTESDAYRDKVAAARADLDKVLSAPQAQILGQMITPPGPYGRGGMGGGGRRAMRGPDDDQGAPGMGRRRGATDDTRSMGRIGGRSGTGPRRGADGETAGMGRRGGRGGGGGMGMGPGPMIQLDRLIDLLEQKHAALR